MFKQQTKILSMYSIAILLGVLVGCVGSLFQLSIHGVDTLLNHCFIYVKAQAWPVPMVSAGVSMLMVLIAFLLVRWISPEGGGSGVQEIEGALLHKRPILWRQLLPVKFIGGVLAISAKMASGREGPTIQMGGNLGAMLGEAFKISSKRRDAFIAAGSAAGLAVAFNAPLAGVLFVIEEMRNQFNFSFVNFKIVAICCFISTIILHLIIGSKPAISMTLFNEPSLQLLWIFFLYGILIGFLALIFNILLMKTLRIIKTFSIAGRYTYVLIIGLVIGYLAYTYPTLVGGGYDIIEQSLTISPSFSALAWLIFLRFIITILCYGTGAPGGVFAPMLALGTLCGLTVPYILHILNIDIPIESGMFAVAGMAAFFSASVRAPITGIILVVEMTQNYLLILPLMVTCLTSTTLMQLFKNKPLYTQLLTETLITTNKQI